MKREREKKNKIQINFPGKQLAEVLSEVYASMLAWVAVLNLTHYTSLKTSAISHLQFSQ
jgi:hypothetical protein